MLRLAVASKSSIFRSISPRPRRFQPGKSDSSDSTHPKQSSNPDIQIQAPPSNIPDSSDDDDVPDGVPAPEVVESSRVIQSDTFPESLDDVTTFVRRDFSSVTASHGSDVDVLFAESSTVS